MMRIILTGHRPDKLGGYERDAPLRQVLRDQLRTAFSVLAAEAWCRGDRDVVLVTGGALGIDQDGAGVALRMGLPYEVYVPFEEQELRWPKPSQVAYKVLLARAQRVVLCYPGRPDWGQSHARHLPLQRNLRMLRDAPEARKVLVSVWDGSEGGTAHCTRAAEREYIPVWRIDPREAEGRGREWAAQRARAAVDGAVCV